MLGDIIDALRIRFELLLLKPPRGKIEAVLVHIGCAARAENRALCQSIAGLSVIRARDDIACFVDTGHDTYALAVCKLCFTVAVKLRNIGLGFCAYGVTHNIIACQKI